ncbi:glycosyltransferase [Candidatus Uhrbacteria bacterium]|nr:glycosyltransferase [Candidatus Uhrbacteria bacterium]
MKIGIVTNLYPPDARGGAELVAQRVADALYERGHEVFVLSTQPYDGLRSLFPRIRERTLEAVYRFFPLNLYYLRDDRSIPFPVRLLWHVIDLFSIGGARAIRSVIRDENPEIIITHNLKGIGVSIGHEIQKQHVPHIHVLHDVQLSIPSGLLLYGQEDSWLNRSFLRTWYERGVHREIGSPDLVLSPSSFLLEFYHARGLFVETRSEVLPNPLPPDTVMLRTERFTSRTQFLYVGQLEEHKGIRELLDAFDQVGEGMELHIAGEGSLADVVSARSELNTNVSFHGFVSLNHLIRLLKTTDAVIVPSTCYENSPTVIYESFLVGVPVIATRIGGIPELIQEGETGVLVTPGDIDDLARAMKEVHQDRDKWWGKGKAIRKQAEQYSISNYVDRLEQFIQELV